MINTEITVYSTKIFNPRFCLITKSEFRYYKSKEQFLTLQKPLCIVPFFRITNVEIFKAKIGKNEVYLLEIKLSEIQNYQVPYTHRKESMNILN